MPTPTGLSFPVEAGRSYLATSVLRHPLVRKIQGSALKKTGNQADYLLLAPKAFLPAAKPLLDLRQSEGLSTMGVSLEDVYETFGHGEVSPEAIKAFLEYAYQSWASPSPRYVLLLGDASYDPKDYLQTGVKDRLPGFPVKTSFLWTVSDPMYASVNGEDLLPDIAIGRLPAGSLDEALRMVEKILSYENGGRRARRTRRSRSGQRGRGRELRAGRGRDRRAGCSGDERCGRSTTRSRVRTRGPRSSRPSTKDRP